MNSSRRGFLGSILALGAAPAIVRADSLMRIIPMETEILQAWSVFDPAAMRADLDDVIWDVSPMDVCRILSIERPGNPIKYTAYLR